MKLYYSKGACSLAVRIIINELGVKAEYEAVDLKTKKTEHGKDYLQVNPKGAVPTVELEDKQVLTENAAIQQYLADKNNAKNLLPAVGDAKRYRVLEWLNFVSTDLHKSCGPLFNADVSEEMKENVFRPLLKKKLMYADQALKENKFLTGDEFTLPDGYLFVVLRWLHHLGLNIQDFPNLVRFFNEAKQRKAIQQSLQEEGLAQ